MLIKIGWRNLWRNPRRSLLMLAAIVSGIWGLVMVYGLDNGMLIGMVDVAIMSHHSHIQVHAEGYHENPGINRTLDDPLELMALIKNADHVKAVAPRAKVKVMISSAEGSSGVRLIGVDPVAEAAVVSMPESIIDGRFLESGDKAKVLIGSGLAKKLRVKPGKKLVIYARASDMSPKQIGVKVAGIYDTGAPDVDKFMAFVPLSFFQDELEIGKSIHEIAIKIDEAPNLDAAKAAIVTALSGKEGLEILTWEELFPFLVQMVMLMAIMNYAMLGCVGIAMALGIANTMIMAVFERFRELGILKAVGTTPAQIFTMIIFESILLTGFGLLLGTGVGYLTLVVWDIFGLDLSIASQGLKSYGIPTVIYPEVFVRDWILTWVAVVVMALGACIYPALKAARQKPVDAMRFM